MIINSYIFSSGYTARTTAFATATGIVDTTILNALNTFDLGLVSNSLDIKMKALYPFVGNTATTQKYNFMDARDLDIAFRIQFNGGWSFSSTGALPNGTNAYANTFLTPNISLSQNDCGISYYSRTNRSINYGVPIGAYVDSGTQLLTIARAVGDIMYNRIATQSFNGDTYSGITDSRGFWTGSRVLSSYSVLYRNGTSLGNGSVVSSGVPTIPLYIGSTNSPLGSTLYDNEELAIAIIHNGLNASEALILSNLVQTLQTSLARNV